MSRLRSMSVALRVFVAVLAYGSAGCGPGDGLPDWDRDGSPDPFDCAPQDPTIRPGALDGGINGVDEDCSGIDGVDGDGDGVAAGEGPTADCDDLHPGRYPGLVELPDDGIDQDCDGQDLRCDGDGDGFGTGAPGCPAQISLDCDDNNAACTDGEPCLDDDGDGDRGCDGDCAEADPNRGPSLAESCDGADNDCDGGVPADELDADGDGVSLCGGDCAEGMAAVHPGAIEVCDAFDNDCDGQRLLPAELDQDGDLDPGCTDCDDADSARSTVDSDGDGTSTCAFVPDCDDLEPSRAPGRPDSAGDGFDQNCDGVDGVDADGDGLAASGGDCDDTEPACGPAADCADADGDQLRVCDLDCDDTLANVAPGLPEICDGEDSDCDGTLPAGEVDLDLDGDPACADCDDLDASRTSLDVDGDGIDTCAVVPDCDDTVAARRPGVPDNPGNAFDENCDGVDGIDADGDGFAAFAGDCDDSAAVCQASADCADADNDGFRVCDFDCDDALGSAAPSLPEICDGADSDCDGVLPPSEVDVDDDLDPACSDCDDGDGLRSTLDGDGDGLDTCAPVPDCDDADDSILPGMADGFADAVDQNCDGIDGVDGDGDGRALYFEDCDDSAPACLDLDDCDDADGDLLSPCTGDCDDLRPSVFAGSPQEGCDGLDTDCDGLLPPSEVDDDGDGDPACSDCDDLDSDLDRLDLDGDGATTCDGDCDDGSDALTPFDLDYDTFTPCGGDCSDFNAAVFPGAVEGCDGLDDDCNGLIPAPELDADTDGYFGCAECDDTRFQVFPGAPEACDGLDGDCDGVIPSVEGDLDGDLWVVCEPWEGSPSISSGDCDDSRSETFPGAFDICNNIDDDCDAVVDQFDDFDADGFCLGDCDDGNPEVHPGVRLEDPQDGVDGDCDPWGMDEGWLGRSDTRIVSAASEFSYSHHLLRPCGDVDGDGLPDLALTGTDPADSGRTLISVFSGAGLLPAARAADPVLIGPQGAFARVSVAGGSGVALDMGDIDGDGLDDLLVSAPAKPQPLGRTGWLGLYTGASLAASSADVLDEADALSAMDATLHHILGQGAVVVGDVDGDGLSDVAFRACLGPCYESGSVIRWVGGASFATPGPVSDGDFIGSITPILAFQFLQELQAVGDVTGDGVPDLGLATQNMNYSGPSNYVAVESGAGWGTFVTVGPFRYVPRILPGIDLDPVSGPRTDLVFGGYESIFSGSGIVRWFPSAWLQAGYTYADSSAATTFEGPGADGCGSALAAVPDSDGDGIDEVAIGCQSGDARGRVVVLAGSDVVAGASPVNPLGVEDAMWDEVGRDGSIAYRPLFADHDGDGDADLVVGFGGLGGGAEIVGQW